MEGIIMKSYSVFYWERLHYLYEHRSIESPVCLLSSPGSPLHVFPVVWQMALFQLSVEMGVQTPLTGLWGATESGRTETETWRRREKARDSHGGFSGSDVYERKNLGLTDPWSKGTREHTLTSSENDPEQRWTSNAAHIFAGTQIHDLYKQRCPKIH